MKTPFFFFVLLLFICSNSLYSQPPGYLGKRAAINFNTSAGLSLLGPTQNNRGSNALGEAAGSVGVNYEFSVDFSYVIGRRSSISIFAGQYYTGLRMDAISEPIGIELITGEEYYGAETDNHELLYRVNVRSAGIIYNEFNEKRGALAPLGSRFFVGLKRNFVNASVLDKKTTFYSPGFGNQFGHNNLNIEEKKSFNYLLLGSSNDMLIWDQVFIKVGLRIGLPLDFKFYKYITSDDVAPITSDYDTNPNQFEYEAALFKRLLQHELFRVDIGVGYLLF